MLQKQGDVIKITKEQGCSYINAKVLYRPERGHNSCIEGQDIGDGGGCHGYCHFWIDIGHLFAYAIHVINSNTC